MAFVPRTTQTPRTASTNAPRAPYNRDDSSSKGFSVRNDAKPRRDYVAGDHVSQQREEPPVFTLNERKWPYRLSGQEKFGFQIYKEGISKPVAVLPMGTNDLAAVSIVEEANFMNAKGMTSTKVSA